MGFSQDAYSVIEGQGQVDICTNLSRDIQGIVTATLTTFSITAQDVLNDENGDFMFATEVFTFQPGIAQNCIAVNITDDSILETNEVFGVNLTSALGTNSGQQSANVTITITDDDGKFVCSVQLNVYWYALFLIIYLPLCLY